MQVAELFARLGLRVDNGTFAKADQLIGGIKSQLAGLVALSGAVALTGKSLAFSEALTDLDIAGSGAVGSVDDVRKKILEVSDDTGVAKEQILAGAAAFVSLTGDGKAASASMETFAKVSKATGAQMSDITGVAARLMQNMDIRPEQFEKSFSVLIASGKAGAIELKEMASLFGGLTPAAEKFTGGKGVEGLAKLSGALQLVMQGAGSASQAATMLEALMGSISGGSAARLEKAGIKVFNKDKSLRELDVIIAELKKKDLRRDKLVEIFGTKEAVGAYEQLVKVDGAWADLTASTLQADDVAQDYAKRQKSDAAKIAKAWNKVQNALERVFGVVVKALAWVTDNMPTVVLAVTSLTIALGILKASAIASAIASAAAWIAALAPFVLIALAVAAVILIVEDLYHWMSGGESVFKDLYEAAREWIGNKLRQVIYDAKKAVGDFLGISESRSDHAKRTFNKKLDRGQIAANETALQYEFAAKTPEEQAAIRAMEAEFIARARGEAPTYRGSGTQAGATAQQFQAEITVNSTGGDGRDIAGIIRAELDSWWGGEVRATAAATGE